MTRLRRWARLALAWTMLAANPAAAQEPPPGGPLQSINLAVPFATRSPWRFTATQGPPVPDTIGASDDKVPGVVETCLQVAPSGACDPALDGKLRTPVEDDLFDKPHDLERADIVHPRAPAGPALLLVQTASLHSGDGDQLVRLQALAYNRATDRFQRVYDHLTGRNNNQEVRYIPSGKLAGDIVSVDPTQDAPFGYWVVVNAPGPDDAYHQALRYRSETHYGDGNPLAVIDSEMPAILQRLGLWHPGAPLPLPAGPCPKPHLVQTVLWCE